MGWKKRIYISNHITKTIDGNDISIFSKPKEYFFNVQPISGNADVVEYGTRIKNVFKAVVDIVYKDKIKEGDIAYLEGIKPNSTNTNYNYMIISVREQNQRIAIYFEKLVK